jgi:hypothetical protein
MFRTEQYRLGSTVLYRNKGWKITGKNSQGWLILERRILWFWREIAKARHSQVW